MISVIKKVYLSVLTILLFATASYSQHKDQKTSDSENTKLLVEDAKPSDEPAGIQMSDGILYGKDYDPGITVMEFSDVMKDPSSVNDQVVVVKGDVSEVCQAMGCWMTMSEGNTNVRIKTMHDFFLPKDIAGSKAVVIGKFKVTEITEEMARHYNEETKNPLVKTEDIKGPQKVYEMEAMGIKILNSEPGNKR